MTPPPSASLLRTLAAVSPSSRVLDLGCGAGRHTGALLRLGFDVYACAALPDDVAAARASVRGEAPTDPTDVAQRITRAHPAALGYPDDYFDWVVAYGAYDEAESAAELAEMLDETRRVLKPGGWVWAAMAERAVGVGASPDALTRLFQQARFALAEEPVAEEEAGQWRLRGIYRKVDARTPR